jgi:pilus assembly protein CpaE
LIKILFGVGEPELAGALRAQAAELTDVEVIGIEDSSADVVTAVGSNPGLDVVLVHEELGALPALDLVRELAMRYPQLAVVIIAEEATPEIFTSAMAAGARAVVSRDPTLAELQSRINSAAEWSRSMRRHFDSSVMSPLNQELGTMIVVAGAKGGTGTTTLAIQLSLAATAARRKVCLVDMDLQSGDIPTFMDISHRRSVVDLVPAADDLDGTALAEAIFVHSSGPHILLAPAEGERSEDLTARAARQILSAVRARYELVIVDCGAFMTVGNAMAVELADTVLVTSTPDLPSLRAVKRLGKLWSRLQIRKEDDVSVVLVKHARRNEVQPDFARKVLGMNLLRTTVPAVYRSLEESANTGSPTSVDNGDFKKSIGAIAREIGILTEPVGRRGAKDKGAAMTEFMGIIPFIGIVVLLIWQVVLIGLTSMYASHAANEGARAAAVLSCTKDKAEIDRRARSRVSGEWAKDTKIVCTGSTVRAIIPTPAVLPGFNTDIQITAESEIVREHGGGIF